MTKVVGGGGAVGKSVAALPCRVRERCASLGAVRAVDLAAEHPDARLVPGAEDPDAACRVPFAAEHAGARRKIGVIGRADGDMAVLFHNRERHPTARLPTMPSGKLGTGAVNWASDGFRCISPALPLRVPLLFRCSFRCLATHPIRVKLLI
jgi:hypothetical protein